jgi:hypothetical protein
MSHSQNASTLGPEVSQVVELLLCKLEALSSNPGPTKKEMYACQKYHIKLHSGCACKVYMNYK